VTAAGGKGFVYWRREKAKWVLRKVHAYRTLKNLNVIAHDEAEAEGIVFATYTTLVHRMTSFHTFYPQSATISLILPFESAIRRLCLTVQEHGHC
jgi:hypothetical protein